MNFFVMNLKSKLILLGVFNCSMLSTYTYALGDVYEPKEERSQRLTITATGEIKPQKEIATSVHQVDDIEFLAPSHPSEVLNRTAGVHISDLGGEGHMTAIRQPITTSAVYLFLEDGIPTRPTGLFNHNALYEVNMPQADRVEIIKGPGSALYGSDSIGGVINSITQASPDEFEATLNPEVGVEGWKRILFSTGGPLKSMNTGLRFNLNATDNEGYRDESSYSRVSATARIDSRFSNQTKVTSLLSFSDVDQSGISEQNINELNEQSTANEYHNEVGRRLVSAWRFSSAFSTSVNNNRLITITPFLRKNEMELMPSWMLSYDPNDAKYAFESYGLLMKVRQNFFDGQAQLIFGLDTDYSPATYEERRLAPLIEDGIYVNAPETGRVNYDFEANQLSLSPYIHAEWQMSENIRLVSGVRYDHFKVKYEDLLSEDVAEFQSGADRFTHLRPEDQSIRFDALSPKFETIYQLTKAQQAYISYRHSFRVPGVGQLFRSGASTNTDQLNPVKTDAFEIGIRGNLSMGTSYDIALYHMIVKDEIVSIIDNETLDRKLENAGETQHRGLEVSLGQALSHEWSANLAFSFSEQEYVDFTALIGFPSRAVNYAGNDVPRAPRTLGSLSLRYTPDVWFRSEFDLEVNHVGQYFTDETNQNLYSGQNIVNFIARMPLNRSTDFYTKINNLTDRAYSTYTSNQVGSSDIAYRAGDPRSLFVGFKTRF